MTMKDLTCSSCNLPLQYQGKKGNDFVWQCFKCGSKIFVDKKPDGLIDID